MGTRCGDIDVFILFRMIEKEGFSVKKIRDQLTNNSGLLGISGVGVDVRELLKAASEGNQRAELAIDTYAYAVKKYIGAYAASLHGVDALVFSGGIGENSPEIRSKVCEGLEFLGINLDHEKNLKAIGIETEINNGGIPIFCNPYK